MALQSPPRLVKDSMAQQEKLNAIQETIIETQQKVLETHKMIKEIKEMFFKHLDKPDQSNIDVRKGAAQTQKRPDKLEKINATVQVDRETAEAQRYLAQLENKLFGDINSVGRPNRSMPEEKGVLRRCVDSLIFAGVSWVVLCTVYNSVADNQDVRFEENKGWLYPAWVSLVIIQIVLTWGGW